MHEKTTKAILFIVVNMVIYSMLLFAFYSAESREGGVLLTATPFFIITTVIILMVLIKNSEYNEKIAVKENIENSIVPALRYIKSLQHEYKNISHLADLNIETESSDIFASISEPWLASFFCEKYNKAVSIGKDFSVVQPFIIKYMPLMDHDKLIALGNLIDNAITAAPKSGNIQVTFLEDWESYTYTVSNSGNTLRGKDIDQLFEFGVSSLESDNHGYGLYNIYKIMKKNKGEIIIDLEDNKTTFKLKFPKKIFKDKKCNFKAN